MIEQLARFLRARYDELAWWAREASRDRGDYTEGGEHWQWVDGESDQVLSVDPMVSGYPYDPSGVESYGASLRSVEQYPGQSVSYTLPHFVIHTAEEVSATVAGHIIRHDPATALADLDAKQKLIDMCLSWARDVGGDAEACAAEALRILAQSFAEHPDFQPEWR